MKFEIKMPSLSSGMESGKIIRWHKSVGESIRRGDVIAEIETDKANIDMESTVDGKLVEIVRPEGEEVNVGEPIAIVEQD